MIVPVSVTDVVRSRAEVLSHAARPTYGRATRSTLRGGEPVTDDQADPFSAEQSGGDIEYDLAHEAVADSARLSHETEAHASVLPEMPEDSGDYSYDLAHDIPRS